MSQLEEAGYTYYGERGVSGRQLLEARLPHPVHVHVVLHGGDRWNRYIRFRDVLLAHPARACAYQDLKRELVRRHAHDRAAYTGGKTHFIEATLAESVAP